MSLKDIIASDINDVFLDTDEFAELCTVELEGVEYNIPVVIGQDETLGYSKPWDGVYQSDLTVAFSAADVARKPVKGQDLGLNGKQYLVSDCSDAKGLLIVKLGAPDV